MHVAAPERRTHGTGFPTTLWHSAYNDARRRIIACRDRRNERRAAREGQMNPLIGIAAGVVPDIIKLIAGDKTGQLAGQVGKAVADAVGTTDAGEAQTKLAANPAVQVALR